MADGSLPGYDPGLQVLLVFIQDFGHPLLPVPSRRLGGRAGWVQGTPPSSAAALSYTRDSDEHCPPQAVLGAHYSLLHDCILFTATVYITS